MALFYHKFYNKDLSDTAETGSLRDVRMSWSHVNPQTKETVIVLLLTAPSPHPSSIPRGNTQQQPVAPAAYALKTLLFTPETDSSREEEVICSALFEIDEAPEPSVLSGTSGLTFVSTRHFFFLTCSSSAKGALDGFVVVKETEDGGAERWKWQRKPFFARPIDDIPPLRQALGSGERHILLITRTHASEKCENVREDTCDVLMVACAADNDAVLTKNKKNNKNKKYGMNDSHGVFFPSVLQRTHTFLVALLRWSALPCNATSCSWELLHLFVERAVPFQRYMHEAALGKVTSGAWDTCTSAPAEPLPVEPQHCSWCFLQDTDSLSAHDPKNNTSNNTIHSRDAGRVCGAILALVPDPSRIISVVCGGFDSESVSYQLGFASDTTAAGVEDLETAEESLWDFAEDTHTIQRILAGRPLVYLAPDTVSNPLTESNALSTFTTRRHKGGWMKQAGITALLRLFVDFIDDGIESGGGGDKSPEQVRRRRHQHKHGQEKQEEYERQRQGLHIVACAKKEQTPHGRVSLPRTLPWLGTIPLPLGHDSIAALCTDETTCAVVREEENPALRFCTLRTSLASTIPVGDHNHASNVRCFVSINALLNQTRLTYVVQTSKALATTSTIGHWNSVNTSRSIELTDILQLFPSELMMKASSDDADQALAEWMARTAAMHVPLFPDGVPDNPSSLHSKKNEISPELILYIAWRRIAMERYPSLAMTLLDTQCLSYANDKAIHQLAEALCQFLITFLSELDWLAGADGADLLRGVVLLMIGAVSINSDDDYATAIPTATTINQSNTSLCDGASTTTATKVQRINPIELRSVQFLLKQCHRWPSLVEVFFAFVNRRRVLAVSDSIVLDDVIRLWTDEAHNEVLQQFREAQDPDLFLSAVSALAKGNVSPADLAAAACWGSPASNKNTNGHSSITSDPFVTLLQLFIDVAVKASQCGVSSVASVKRMILDIIQSRFPTYGVVPSSVLLRMSEFNFACLADWPLATMGGALPQALLIHHLAAQASKEERDDNTVNESLTNAARMFHWLCGEKEERAVLVMRNLCKARVSLIDLALSRPRLCSSACSRALHHILVLPQISLLKDAFITTNPSEESNVTSVQMALAVWAAVLEGDKTAVFNPKLLHVLFEALKSNVHTDVTVLLDYLQPIFMTAVPRMLAVAGEDTDSVSGVLSLMRNGLIASEETMWLDPPPLESDSVARVCLHTFREVNHLLDLYEKESLEVHCLMQLFRAFRASCSEMLESRLKTHASRSHRDAVPDVIAKTVSDAEEAEIFAFNPQEMFFIALQVVNSEPVRFVIAAEVMRRSLRPFLQRRMECFIPDGDKTSSSNEVNPRCRDFVNTTLEEFEMVISAFEVTAPLYERTLILLFVDELVAYLNMNSDTNESHISVQVRMCLLECTERVATTEWKELHRQEKRLLRRILSDHLIFLLKEESVENFESSTASHYEIYAESEAHHCAVKETARLHESLHQQPIDTAILHSVQKFFLTDSPLSPELNASGCETPDTGTVDTLQLLIKEESYIRRHTQKSLSQLYDTYIGSNTFQQTLAVLYLALREEQRRRVFVDYALQQKDIIFTFEYMACAQISKLCGMEAETLKQRFEEEFYRRVRFLCTQEREARSGVEAVWHVGREITIAHACAQRDLFATETRTFRALAEQEELERDALYEHCARAELSVARRLAERLEEEAWRAEEAQWAELQATPAADTAEPSGRSKGNAFLKWQERQLATVKVCPSSSPTSMEAVPSHKQFPSAATHSPLLPTSMQKITDSQERKPHMPLPPPSSSSLAEVFSPFFAPPSSSPTAEETDAAVGSGILPTKLPESSDSILSTLSWWQKQIISTVAPPPASRAKVPSEINEFQPDRALANEKKDDTLGSVSSSMQPSVHAKVSAVKHPEHYHHRHDEHSTLEENMDDGEERPFVSRRTPHDNDAGAKAKLRGDNEQDRESLFGDTFHCQQKSNAVHCRVQNEEKPAPKILSTAPCATESRSSSDALDVLHPEPLTHNTTHSSPLSKGTREDTQRVYLTGKRRVPRRRGLGDVVSLGAPLTGDHSDFPTNVISNRSSVVIEKPSVLPSLGESKCKINESFDDTPTAHLSTGVKSATQPSVTTAVDVSTASSDMRAKAAPPSLLGSHSVPLRVPLESGWDEEEITVRDSPVGLDVNTFSLSTVKHPLCSDKDSRHFLQKGKSRATRRKGLGDITSLDSTVQENTVETPEAHTEKESLIAVEDSGAVPVSNHQGEDTTTNTTNTAVVEARLTVPSPSVNLPLLADISSNFNLKGNSFDETASDMLRKTLLEEYALPFVNSENKARFTLVSEEQFVRGLMFRRFVLEL